MCGICGIVDFGPGAIPEAQVQAMNAAIAHRGPDAEGVHVEADVALGSRRLAVIDLSARGHMPMANADRTLFVVQNGEIYNFADLRKQLEQAGHRFHSDSDTEAILHAYAEWGDAGVERLEGMFAFALWDTRRRRVLLARDRLGVKPLYTARRGSRLWFASEVHALYPHVAPTADGIDRDALDAFLAFGYLPADRCFVRGIEKLPPGHRMIVEPAGARVEPYWSVSFRPTRRLSDADALDAVDEALGRAVTRRLRSDVPLGSFLSGGIDSGLVTALAAKNLPALDTFSVGFAGATAEEDERPLARLVAEQYGTRHRELIVETGHRNLLPRALWHVGEPFADVSILPMVEISRQAREHITVALSGDGGDESFCGYANVRVAHLAQQLRRRLPAPARRLLQLAVTVPGLARVLPAAARAKRWLEQYVERPVPGQFDQSNRWNEAWRRQLLTTGADFAPLASPATRAVAALLADAGALSDAEQHLLADLRLRLPGDYLPKVDIASNMVALEIRSPFLDHHLVELAASLPLEQKLLGGQQKGLLRRLAQRHLPPALIEAPKRGFAPNVGTWLRGDWAPMARALCDDPGIVRAGLLRGEVIRRVCDEHLSGRADHGERLFSFLCLEIWWRLFVDRTLSPGDEI